MGKSMLLGAVGIGLVVACTVGGLSAADTAKVRWTDLGTRVRVIGSLGVPLGQIVKINGTVVPDECRKRKADLGKTLIEVSQVNGSPLPKKTVVEAAFLVAKQDLPSPGSPITCIGYETGGYHGVPPGTFDHVPPMTAEGFHFAVRFVILKTMRP